MKGILNEELLEEFVENTEEYKRAQKEEETCSDEEFKESYEELRKIVRKHFSPFDGGKYILNYDTITDRIFYYQALSLTEYFDVEKAVDDLKTFKTGLLRLKGIYDELPEGVHQIMSEKAFYSVFTRGEVIKPGEPSAEERFAQSPLYASFLLVSATLSMLPYYLPLIDKTIQASRAGRKPGRKPMEAWRTVNAAATVCDVLQGTIRVPKRMGPSGPFYRLLIDLFDYFEIPEDPVNVARSWAKDVGR